MSSLLSGQMDAKEITIGFPDIFYVVLPRYDRATWMFSKSAYMKLFPESLLGNTLFLDGTASVIELEQDVVTPEIMSFLWFTVRYGQLPSIPEVDLRNAGAYLGIDIMLFIQGRSYQKSYGSFHYNLLDTTDVRSNYAEIMNTCFEFDDIAFTQYMFNQVDPDQTINDDMSTIPEIALSNQVHRFKMYMDQRRIDLRTAHSSNLEIYVPDKYSLVVPEYYREDLLSPEYQVLKIILYIDSGPMTQYLLDRDLIPEDQLIQMFEGAVSGYKLSVMGVLIQDRHLPVKTITDSFTQVFNNFDSEIYQFTRVFLSRPDIKYNPGALVTIGAGTGHIELVLPYVKGVDESYINVALMLALTNKHLDIVFALLPLASCAQKTYLMTQMIQNATNLSYLPYFIADSCMTPDEIERWVRDLLGTHYSRYGEIMQMFIDSGKLTPEQVQILQSKITY